MLFFYVMGVGDGGYLPQTIFIDACNCVWMPFMGVFRMIGYHMSFMALKRAYGADSAKSGLSAPPMVLRCALIRLNESKRKMTAFAA